MDLVQTLISKPISSAVSAFSGAGSVFGWLSGKKRPRHAAEETSDQNDHSASKASSTAADASRAIYDHEASKHFLLEPGQNIGRGRYKVMSKFGEGTFGMVAECWDRERKRYTAVKIIRKEKKYTDAAQYEIDVLDDIRRSDPKMISNCVHMWGTFHHREHLCISFEPLGMSIYDFMKQNNYTPYSMEETRSIGYQVLKAIEFLNSRKIAHTDLKPENILLVDDSYDTVDAGGRKIRVLRDCRIKVIDFGNATYEKDHHSSIICTHYYRPPEVLLGIRWNYSCDIWSIGCILIELCTGYVIFCTEEDDVHHLAIMERFLGPIPEELVRRADHKSARYFENHRLDWPRIARSEKSIQDVARIGPLPEISPEIRGPFLDLLGKMLIYELEKRPMAAYLLHHDFFSGSLPMKHQEAGVTRSGRA